MRISESHLMMCVIVHSILISSYQLFSVHCRKGGKNQEGSPFMLSFCPHLYKFGQNKF